MISSFPNRADILSESFPPSAAMPSSFMTSHMAEQASYRQASSPGSFAGHIQLALHFTSWSQCKAEFKLNFQNLKMNILNIFFEQIENENLLFTSPVLLFRDYKSFNVLRHTDVIVLKNSNQCMKTGISDSLWLKWFVRTQGSSAIRRQWHEPRPKDPPNIWLAALRSRWQFQSGNEKSNHVSICQIMYHSFKSRINSSYHVSIPHIVYQSIKSRINSSYHVSIPHIVYQSIKSCIIPSNHVSIPHITHQSLKSHVNPSNHVSILHITYQFLKSSISNVEVQLNPSRHFILRHQFFKRN